mmetsp:Transcript_6842/g.13663  ORF Transcript_6842/g.13663 Transcript_6842/m.13663 type:complete len:217 (+) Transcript_6842:253-903(+)
MHHPTPPAQSIPIHTRQKRLRQSLEQLLLPQIRLIKRLAHPVQIAIARPAHHKILRRLNRPDQVHGGQVRTPLLIQPRHHRLGEIRPEPLLVEDVAQEVGEDLGSHGPLFPELVEIHSKSEELIERLDVRGQAGEADEEGVVHFEDFFEIHGDGLVLDAEAVVGGDADAVFAGHGDYGGAVVFEDGHVAVVIILLAVSLGGGRIMWAERRSWKKES